MILKLAELLGLVCPFQAVPYTGDLMGGLYEENVLALKQKEAYNRALEDAWERMQECVCQVGEGVYWIDTITGTPPAQRTFEGPGYLAWIPKGEDAMVKGASMGTINRFRTPLLLQEEDAVIYQTKISGISWGWHPLPSDRTYMQWAIEGW